MLFYPLLGTVPVDADGDRSRIVQEVVECSRGGRTTTEIENSLESAGHGRININFDLPVVQDLPWRYTAELGPWAPLFSPGGESRVPEAGLACILKEALRMPSRCNSS
jgi:hypothetical protein